ncbi:MAG TPA: radical SAM protein [Vicinamibacteria bacterium]|nr:radical SAM protein [Vicinamibacteria bacterium]
MTVDSLPHTLSVFLVKPSKYDDDGYVVRHWRGVLPSNTLACLHGLTEDVKRSRALGDVELSVHLVDEAVAKVPVRAIARTNARPGEKAVVALVGVQTNQFCRASDLALALRRSGVTVLLGGFHVSGMMSLFSGLSPEVQELVDAGVTIVAGEVEDHWGEILRAAHRGELQPIYRYLDELPDLSEAPRPIVDKTYLRRFVSSNFGTIDTSRGCPFNCSFCTIINVQGRKSRHRSPDCIAETLRANYRERGVDFYFFTDDDFARNPAWEGIFDALIELREKEGIPVEFMIQVDVASYRIPGFVDKAARAGCSNVFIGMESINPESIKDAGKAQNKVSDYRNLIDAWHRAKVSTHVGYIIGFPHDSEESVAQDVEKLMAEVQPHRASFFMLTPLPGSRDHKNMVDAGAPMDSDYNTYDSFHESMPHALMRDGAWSRAYRRAWATFYSFENMKRVLDGVHPDRYWDVLRNFYWYKSSALNEGAHPMITGFFRIKDRKSRRPSFPREGVLAHARRRLPEIYGYIRGAVRLTLEFEELWLQTRKRSETEMRVHQELARMREELSRSLRVSELRTAYLRAKSAIPGIEVPSRLRLWNAKLSVLQASRLRETRSDLHDFWGRLRERLRQGRVDALLRFDRIALNALRELRITAGFFVALAAGNRLPSAGR